MKISEHDGHSTNTQFFTSADPYDAFIEIADYLNCVQYKGDSKAITRK